MKLFYLLLLPLLASALPVPATSRPSTPVPSPSKAGPSTPAPPASKPPQLPPLPAFKPLSLAPSASKPSTSGPTVAEKLKVNVDAARKKEQEAFDNLDRAKDKTTNIQERPLTKIKAKVNEFFPRLQFNPKLRAAQENEKKLADTHEKTVVAAEKAISEHEKVEPSARPKMVWH